MIRLVIFLVVCGNLSALIIGGLVGSFPDLHKPEALCSTPKTKWSYVLPGYRLGCWLSEPLKSDSILDTYKNMPCVQGCGDK